ncbi:MAG: NADP-dependent phosphogluconate dehydrogenase [Anaerorhabdus sp.]|uniref:NADP-dependent phosphogluconate dehydrogenase n=2 Tax=Anaerorhabdus sp. TaxID=1872524 RepID=UPI002FC8A8D2
MTKNDIGVIGLGTMGKNLALNLANKGFKVAGFNRTYVITKEIENEKHDNFKGYEEISEFVDSLEKPAKIIVMVKAGEPVDMVCDQLLDFLIEGDIIIDAGNSYFKDTMRRHDFIESRGIFYFGVGVSGGEKGALLGPSIMPGGDKDAYDLIKPYLETIAAQKNGEPCCTYIGPNGAGHYVKMVHNGIEYADMQLIAESYLLLKEIGHFSNQEMADIFEEWNSTELRSYLVEITAKILREKDELTDLDLVDMIVDKASQKGTGKWTILEAINQDFNVSLIQAAVQARITSNLVERDIFSRAFLVPNGKEINPKVFKEEVRKAYTLGKLIAYAQGFSLMYDASIRYDWQLDLGKIASIFRAGCIIQAELLEVIMNVYKNEEVLSNFLVDGSMINQVNTNIQSLRVTNSLAILAGVPIPVLSSAITYLDQLRSKLVGANLIQAQRDFFGAHTFERIDVEGKVHHEWEN